MDNDLRIKRVLLRDVASNISRPFKLSDNEIAIFLNTGDVLEGRVLHKNFTTVKGMPGQAKKSIRRGDILFSEIRPANKRFAMIDFDS